MQHKNQLLEYKNIISQLYQLKASKDNELINKDKEIDNLTSRIKELQSSINKDIKEDLDKILMESAVAGEGMGLKNKHPTNQKKRRGNH